MRIGIYLAYRPIKNFSLKQEGLGRYLAYIIKSFVKNEHEVVIACPSWIVEGIEELFEEENIDQSKVELLISKTEPIIFKLYMKLLERKTKEKRRRKSKIKNAATRGLDSIFDLFLMIKNQTFFVIILLLALMAIIVISPIILAFSFIAFLLRGILKLFKIDFKSIRLKKILLFIKNNNKITLKLWNHVMERYLLENKVIYRIRENTASDIIRKIGNMKNPTDLWYCPMAFWPEFNEIPGIRVVCVPDLVVSEFATNFTIHPKLVSGVDDVRNTIQGGQFFITYCDYVKETLVVNQFRKKGENVIAIPHAINDMSDSLDIMRTFSDQFPKIDMNKVFARKILQSIGKNVINVQEYIAYEGCEFSFKDVEYIFYASQIRGNKNILNLIKSYEYLLRKKAIPIKLFLTCDININKEVKEYIYDRRLQYDVVCFHSVSSQQLAALYRCAKLVVNPTLYEGGFPFTFGEGMSVGTPSVMSKIPQVMEVIEKYDVEKYFFDPYDFLDMASKIEYGILNTEKLFEAELKLYNDLNIRKWVDVGEEYVKAFQYFIDQSFLGEKNEC